MPELVFKLPDVGEGIAEAEIVEWLVAEGDEVEVDQPLVEVMTDKATVELPSPHAGRITALTGVAGDLVAVGTVLVRFAGDDPDVDAVDATPPANDDVRVTTEPTTPRPTMEPEPPRADLPDRRRRVLASPTVRRRAAQAGIDLGLVPASGPGGRVEHGDVDAYLAAVRNGRGVTTSVPAADRVTDTRIIGLRRKIAERMSLATSRIPHITYVDEVDMTELERLRQDLNRELDDDRARLTILPFLIRAVRDAVQDVPAVNATFDDEEGVLHQHEALHVGIATQTPGGLLVPVLRHAGSLGLWETAGQLRSLTERTRAGSAAREELTGSTITISSLGALGGLVTTPVINHPEVAIVGVNKLQVRPFWDGARFVPRSMMNLSSSFDHRIIDGWDAARFVQAIKRGLEQPARLFLEGS